ncbi:monovalent cation/H+ antiporter subunit B [Clostridiales bacterium PH28_bin88]|nr:monovalent cation/H+ antiporter subunit B [Clostridiales bacterium PH28_bin88]
MNPEQVILRTIARQALYVIMVFSFFLYGRGHNEPGGGFIAGLMSSAAVVALYMAFSLEFVKKAFPVDYLKVVALGLTFAVGTGLGTMFWNELFMNHTFTMVHLPFFGELELTTAAIFDFGVYLVVVGGTLTIISMIGGER